MRIVHYPLIGLLSVLVTVSSISAQVTPTPSELRIGDYQPTTTPTPTATQSPTPDLPLFYQFNDWKVTFGPAWQLVIPTWADTDASDFYCNYFLISEHFNSCLMSHVPGDELYGNHFPPADAVSVFAYMQRGWFVEGGADLSGFGQLGYTDATVLYDAAGSPIIHRGTSFSWGLFSYGDTTSDARWSVYVGAWLASDDSAVSMVIWGPLVEDFNTYSDELDALLANVEILEW